MLGVEDVGNFIIFEERVRLDRVSFIDCYISSAKVLIEQKGLSKDLRKQSADYDTIQRLPRCLKIKGMQTHFRGVHFTGRGYSAVNRDLTR